MNANPLNQKQAVDSEKPKNNPIIRTPARAGHNRGRQAAESRRNIKVQ
jgi:hypothetical protein